MPGRSTTPPPDVAPAAPKTPQALAMLAASRALNVELARYDAARRAGDRDALRRLAPALDAAQRRYQHASDALAAR